MNDENENVDGRALVRAGYDRIAEAYLATRGTAPWELALLDELAGLLPAGARVLDAGCGAGVPVARELARRGLRVTGVDFSEAQLALARQHVPEATFLLRDMTELDFPPGSFEAVVSFFAIIHVPREQHAALLRDLYALLVPGGYALLSMGRSDSAADIEQDWIGGGAPMYWSHFDHPTNLRLLREAGFDLLRDQLIAESDEFGGGTHLFVLARRPEDE